MNRNLLCKLFGMKAKIPISRAFGTGQLGRNVRNCIILGRFRMFSSATLESNQTEKIESSKEIWELCVGLLVERKPVITSEKNAMEKKYLNFLNQYEIEMSKKSDHEIRLEKDLITHEKVKSGEIDQGTIQTAQDFEDTSTAELNEFVFQSRFTEADVKKDCKSLQRALDSHLVLLVQQKLGKDLKWLLPQTKRLEGETLRQVAERIVIEICPEKGIKVLSNAPWGFYKYKYPKDSKTQDGKPITGAKVFFYKAQIPSAGVTSSLNQKSALNISDYMWLTHSELKSKLTQTSQTQTYYKSVSDILCSVP